MAAELLVVIAAGEDEAGLASCALWSRGATGVDRRPAGDRVLLYATLADDATAAPLVADLRSQGWPAVVRPVAGGHLAAWQGHTRPVVVGDRLWVAFPWSEFDRGQAPLLVEIDPGRAFGTGAHPSTKLLLTELLAGSGAANPCWTLAVEAACCHECGSTRGHIRHRARHTRRCARHHEGQRRPQ